MAVVLIVPVVAFIAARRSRPTLHAGADVPAENRRPTATPSPAARRSDQPSATSLAALKDLRPIELPTEFFEKQLTDNELKAYEDANREALSAKSLDDAARIYAQYIDRYPLSQGSAVMLNRLGNVQVRLGRYDDARRSLNAARDLVGKDRFASIVDLNVANIALASGDLAQAEQQLNAMINKPLPAPKDVFGYAAQGFLAPTYLAKLRLAQGKGAEADQIVRSVADRAMSLVGHVEDDEWALGYVAQAYSDRIQLILDAEPDNLAAATKVAEELRVRLKDHDGNNRADGLLAGIDLWKQQREMIRQAAASGAKWPKEP